MVSIPIRVRGITGINVIIDIFDKRNQQIVNAGVMAEISSGLYSYTFSTPNQEVFTAQMFDQTNSRSMGITNVDLRPRGGGGLGLTGDMVMTLKKIGDNVASRKEIEEFFSKLTGIETKFDNIIKKKDNARKKDISKMEENLQNISNDSQITKSEIIKTMRDGLQVINDRVQENESTIKKVIELNQQNLKKLDNLDLPQLDAIKKDLSLNISELIAVRSESSVNIFGLSEEIRNLFKEIKEDKQIANQQMSKFEEVESKGFDSLRGDLLSIKSEVGTMYKEIKVNQVPKMSDMLKVHSTNTNQKIDNITFEIEKFEKSLVDIAKINKDYKEYLEEHQKTAITNNKEISKGLDKSILQINERIDSIKPNMANIKHARNDIKAIASEINELKLKSTKVRDINRLEVGFGDKIDSLNKKITSLELRLNTKLTKISKSSKRDDLDIDKQMEMLGLNM